MLAPKKRSMQTFYPLHIRESAIYRMGRLNLVHYRAFQGADAVYLGHSHKIYLALLIGCFRRSFRVRGPERDIYSFVEA